MTIAEFEASGLGGNDVDYWNDNVIAGNDAPATNLTLYEVMQYASWLTENTAGTGSPLYENKEGSVCKPCVSRTRVKCGPVRLKAIPM